jgi:preprotein translocase subunit SecE
MAETDNPDAPLVAPRAARFGEGPEGKAARQERGESGKQSGPGRLVQFIHDVRAEMRRVSWPTLNHVKNTTIITLVAVVFFAVYLFLVDQGLSRLILGLDWVIEKIIKFLGLG